MSDLAGVMAAAAEVETFCRGRGWRYCFIGGIAVQRWGMPLESMPKLERMIVTVDDRLRR